MSPNSVSRNSGSPESGSPDPGPPDSVSTTTLLAPWTGEFGGVPPWDRIDVEAFVPAVDRAMADAMEEIDAIAANPDSPTFENTIEALERAGRGLGRLAAVFNVHAGNLNVGPLPEIEKIIGPKFAAHGDAVVQHAELFARVEAVRSQHFDSDDQPLTGSPLDEARRRLLLDRYRGFVRNGALLGADDKIRLSEINQRLAGLFTDFSQNVLADETEVASWIDDPVGLAGLPESLTATLAAAASERGRPGTWAVLNTRASMDPFLTYAEDRSKREEVWRAFYGRGDKPGERDNKPIIAEILRLRAERAALLGYESHAHWRLENAMAKHPENTLDLMNRVWPRAVARAREEVADMQAVADAEAGDDGPAPAIEPWDYRFYAEKVRKVRYDLDFNEVTPYLQLEKLIAAMLWCSSELYGLRYAPVEPATRVPVFHPDVRVWEVTDADGGPVGLWYLDPYAREGKSSGAWMTAYRAQEAMDEPISTLVSNNSNFVKGADGAPVLVSWDDAVTLFHEFGHALHGLLSDVTYPSQSGTAVARDFVEFPSQINEQWLSTSEVLNRFCRHVDTDEPMPAELIERIERAANFNQGFDTVEYLACALLDMQLHLIDHATLQAQGDIDPDRFEREALDSLGAPSEIPMRHRLPHFAHIFSTESYSAGYYGYMWSDVLTADAAEAFTEAGGYFDNEVAERLRANVFSVGDTVDPADGYRAFRGRDADPDALLRKRGFPVG